MSQSYINIRLNENVENLCAHICSHIIEIMCTQCNICTCVVENWKHNVTQNYIDIHFANFLGMRSLKSCFNTQNTSFFMK